MRRMPRGLLLYGRRPVQRVHVRRGLAVRYRRMRPLLRRMRRRTVLRREPPVSGGAALRGLRERRLWQPARGPQRRRHRQRVQLRVLAVARERPRTRLRAASRDAHPGRRHAQRPRKRPRPLRAGGRLLGLPLRRVRRQRRHLRRPARRDVLPRGRRLHGGHGAFLADGRLLSGRLRGARMRARPRLWPRLRRVRGRCHLRRRHVHDVWLLAQPGVRPRPLRRNVRRGLRRRRGVWARRPLHRRAHVRHPAAACLRRSGGRQQRVGQRRHRQLRVLRLAGNRPGARLPLRVPRRCRDAGAAERHAGRPRPVPARRRVCRRGLHGVRRRRGVPAARSRAQLLPERRRLPRPSVRFRARYRVLHAELRRPRMWRRQRLRGVLRHLRSRLPLHVGGPLRAGADL